MAFYDGRNEVNESSQGALATTSPQTFDAPASFKALAQADIVPPVVAMSSIRSTALPPTSPSQPKLPSTLRHRSSGLFMRSCDGVFFTFASSFSSTGMSISAPSYLPSSAA